GDFGATVHGRDEDASHPSVVDGECASFVYRRRRGLDYGLLGPTTVAVPDSAAFRLASFSVRGRSDTGDRYLVRYRSGSACHFDEYQFYAQGRLPVRHRFTNDSFQVTSHHPGCALTGVVDRSGFVPGDAEESAKRRRRFRRQQPVDV